MGADKITGRPDKGQMDPETPERPRRFRGLKISAVIISLILFICTIYFERIKSDYVTQNNEKKEYFSRLDRQKVVRLKEFTRKLSARERQLVNRFFARANKQSQFIQRTKEFRTNYFKQALYVQYPLKYSYTVANFLRQLSLQITKKIRLTDFQAEPEDLKVRFKFKGSVSGEGNQPVLAHFLEFIKKLEDLENMLDISFEKVEVSSAKLTGGTIIINEKDPEPDPAERIILFFSVTGVMELE